MIDTQFPYILPGTIHIWKFFRCMSFYLFMIKVHRNDECWLNNTSKPFEGQTTADKKLCRQMSNTQRCLHPLLPNHRNSKTIKKVTQAGTVNITTFYYTSRSTSSKTVFKQMSVFIHLA